VACGLLGVYQPGNALLAAAAARELGADEGAIRAGLRGARWPGRFQIFRRDPLVILDGAHNPAGAEWLLERLPSRERVIVCSRLADKDAVHMLRTLRRAGDTFVATRSSSARALPADDLARLARPLFARVETAADPAAARELALGLGRPVLVTGSLYLLADLVPCLRNEQWGNLVPG